MPAAKTRDVHRAGRPKNPVSKSRLIEIATQFFAENGYHGTSLDSIAVAAGIRRASLLHHFADKRALYFAALDRIVGDVRDFIAAAGRTEADFAEALDRLGNRIMTYFSRRPGVARLLVRELVDGGPYFRGDNIQSVLDILGATTAFLRAGMEAGAFQKQDPRQLALSIAGMHLYYFSTTPSISLFIGDGAFGRSGLKRRREAVLEHVRRLCLGERGG